MKIRRNFKMGNVLCKSRKGQPQSNKTPIDGIIGRCSQICHNPIGKKKHFWDKQILETSPPCKQQPKLNDSGYSTVSLTVPDSPDYHPVPPPRKKRHHSTRTDKNESDEQNDFDKQENKKILVVENKSDDSSKNDEKYLNIIVNEENKLKERLKENGLKLNDDTKLENVSETSNVSKESGDQKKKSIGTSTHNVSKIGNKKSDKFFGENLSESLSDEPIMPEENEKLKTPSLKDNYHEKLKTEEDHETEDVKDKSHLLNDEKIKSENSKDETDYQKSEIKIIDDSEEMMHKINKEKGNLLFSIKSQIPDEKSMEIDPDAKPVEEEIIVPVKRQTRHICDDDTHIHNVLHKTHPVSDITPPKKPQRDFSRYRKSLENLRADQPTDSTSHVTETLNHSEDETMNKPLSTSEEELHSETETTPLKKSSDKISSPSKSEVSEITTPNLTKSETILRNLSSQSHLTSDLIEEIAQQANNLSMSPEGYLPEDYPTSSNDGSSSFSPNSKLTEKKHRNSQSSILDDRAKSTKLQSESIKPVVITNGQVLLESNAEENKDDFKLNLRLEDKDEYLPNYEEATGIIRNSLNSATTPTEIKPITPQNTSSPSIQQDSPKKLPIDPNFHRKVSSTKEISDAIKSFLSKDDLNPKEMLKLLEEEFGDLLNSPCLSPEDREIIQKLQDSANLIENESISKDENQQTELKSDEKLKQDDNKLTNIESPIKSNTIKIENQFDLKSPSIINKVLDSVMSNENRRHSIDDLDSWFSSDVTSKQMKVDYDSDDEKVKYRKREISLPNAFDITTTSISLSKSPAEIKTELKNESDEKNDSNKQIKNEIIISNKNDHSPLLKFLENEKANYNH